MTWKNWKGSVAKAIVKRAGLEALRDVGETVLTNATNNVPLEFGTLRRSGTVTVGGLPDSDKVYAAAEAGQDMGKAYTAPVGSENVIYVSYNTPYAAKLHELSGSVNWSEPGTGPKYLENSFNQQKQKAKPYVEKMINKALERA